MPRRPFVPTVLKHGPFTLAEANQAGLTRHQLSSEAWNRVGPGIYVWSGLRKNPMVLIQAAARRMPPNAVFSGLTAAWLHGLDVLPCDPVEITMPHSAGIWSRAGLAVSRAHLDEGYVIVRGVHATSIERTISDLAGRLPLIEAVVIADMALGRGLLEVDDLRCFCLQRRGWPGVRALRRVIELGAVGAESPMETRLRLLLVFNGLPCPELQKELLDENGRLMGRVDMYFPAARLVVEYDGEGHRDRLVEDNRRQNLLQNHGYQVLRFTAADLRSRPDAAVALVRSALGTSGTP